MDIVKLRNGSNMKIEITLIKFEGKPLEKLLDVINKGCGVLYEPRRIRKKADAKAYEIEKLGKAKARTKLEIKGMEQDFNDRISGRLAYKEGRKQQNIDQINSIAAQELKNEDTVSDEPVNEDWATRFFNIVEDISDEEMQEIWGRILAGEVKRPKSYSLRTLELLRNLSYDEAQCFLKYAKMAINFRGLFFLPNPEPSRFYWKKYKIDINDRQMLEELGLLMASDKELRFNSDAQFIVGNFYMEIERKDKNSYFTNVHVRPFTKVGSELIQLIQGEQTIEYIQYIASLYRAEGFIVKFATITEIKGNGIHHIGDEIHFTDLVDVPLTEEEIKKKDEESKKAN